jgi:outer membrane immunogenic protein
MKKFLITVKTVVITMGIVGVAYADQGFAQHSLLNSWTGFYVGANAGIAFNNVRLNVQQLGFSSLSQTYNANSNFSTFFPGIQFGYMYQFANNLVSGIEANVTINTHQADTLTYPAPYNNPGYDQFSFKDRLQSSIKGRLGRALHWHKKILLPYVTAGVSFANVQLTYNNEGGDYYYKSTTAPGWLLGAGMEWAVNANWSLRAEYSYIDYGSAINMNIPSVFGLIDPNGVAHAKLSSNNIAVSVNYWF